MATNLTRKMQTYMNDDGWFGLVYAWGMTPKTCTDMNEVIFFDLIGQRYEKSVIYQKAETPSTPRTSPFWFATASDLNHVRDYYWDQTG